MRFDGKDDLPWWTFRPLEHLDVSHNSLKKLSPQGSALYTLKELHVCIVYIYIYISGYIDSTPYSTLKN